MQRLIIPTTRQSERSGAYIVEFSLVVPVFVMLLVGIMEFGHAYMVVATINGAAKAGARLGGIEGVTTQQVRDRVSQTVSTAIRTSNATIHVKDATVFDTDPLAENVDYAALPDIELASATERQLFVVRVEVPYNDVALLPPFWIKDFRLVGQSVMRHE